MVVGGGQLCESHAKMAHAGPSPRRPATGHSLSLAFVTARSCVCTTILTETVTSEEHEYSGILDSSQLSTVSGGIKRDKIKGQMTEIRSFSLIFADFCRFSLFLGITAFGGRIFAENRQKFAANRRFLQKPICPTLFPF